MNIIFTLSSDNGILLFSLLDYSEYCCSEQGNDTIFGILISISLDSYPEIGLLDHMVVVLWGNFLTVHSNSLIYSSICYFITTKEQISLVTI